jgi:hypothetical protein
VNRPRDQFLSGAARLNQDRRPARRGLDDQVEDLHPLVAADDVRELLILLLPWRSSRFSRTSRFRSSAFHDDQDFVVLERQ